MAKAKMPTKTEQNKINKKLQAVFDNNPQFIPFPDVKKWYGINSESARNAFREAWEICCQTNGVSGKRPTLSIGAFPKPKGFVIVRSDQNWLEKL
jgi:hypothetical protein